MPDILPCGCRSGFTICSDCTPELLIETIPELERAENGQSFPLEALIDLEYPAELVKVEFSVEEIHDLLVVHRQKLSESQDLTVKKYAVNPRNRFALVEWLMDIHVKCFLKSETIVRAVHLFDTFTSLRQIPVCEIQVTGTACLLIASKLYEVYPLVSDDLVKLSDGDFNLSRLHNREYVILKSLQWKLTHPTVRDFYFAWLTLMLRSGFVKHSEQQLGRYLLLLSLLNVEFASASPDQSAAAILYLTIEDCRAVPDDEFEQLTGFTVKSLASLIEHLRRDHEVQSARSRDQKLSIRQVYEMNQKKNRSVPVC